MEMQILKQKEVPLLDRKRVTAQITFLGKSTPSGGVLRTELAKLIKSEPKFVTIRHIYQKFGVAEAKVIAHVYKDVKTLKAFEGEKAALKEAPKEEVKEAPKGETKEAPKEEGN